MNPWPVEADVPEVHLPRPGHADLAGRAEVRLHRRAQRARARQRPRDRGARGRRRAGQGVPARARRRGRLARHPDRLGAARRSATASRSPTSPASTSRRCAAWTPRRRRRWSRRSTCCASATSRSAASSSCARSGSCPGSARTSPGSSGWTAGSARRMLSIQAVKGVGLGDGFDLAGRPGLGGPRRDLLLATSAATTARRTAPAASRAA